MQEIHCVLVILLSPHAFMLFGAALYYYYEIIACEPSLPHGCASTHIGFASAQRTGELPGPEAQKLMLMPLDLKGDVFLMFIP